MQGHECVHLETQGDRVAGLAMAGHEGQIALVVGRDLRKQIQVGGEVTLAEPVLRQLDQKAVVAGLGAVVERGLEADGLPALVDHVARVEIAADGVVPAQVVLDDGGEDTAHVGIQAVAAGELEGVLALERVRQVEPFQQVLRVVHEHADVGVGRARGKRHRAAATQAQRPVLAAGQMGLISGFAHDVMSSWICLAWEALASRLRSTSRS